MQAPPTRFELHWRRWSCLVVAVTMTSTGLADKVDFNRDVRPVLVQHCFACHGPDAKQVKGGLRLDQRDSATRAAKSGRRAIVPGAPAESELVRRIMANDPEELMPPLETHKPLSAPQREMLVHWIAEGAEYRAHWAFSPPVKPPVPTGVNPVDYLVRRRLESLGLKPSGQADRRTLSRRLYFDLVGLPPTPAEVQSFQQDTAPDAYERLVERLLASPHYGERMAVGWLDVVRFADTIGYHSDNPRNIWPYRDYVIRAFNENLRFDQFTREQLAGDLLAEPTLSQRVASGFNRLLLTTEEGGAQPKDYEARYLADRVRALGTIWFGLTLGCAQCHDHKFDPITMVDFYALGAFFADVKEAPVGRREAGMWVADSEEMRELARRERLVERLQREYDKPRPELADAFAAWQRAQRLAMTNPASSTGPDKELAELLKSSGRSDVTPDGKLFTYFKERAPEFAELRQRLSEASKARAELEATVPRTLVTERWSEPRPVRILPRGNWMLDSGAQVEPALPAFLAKEAEVPSRRRLNRLDLANWIVSRNNPLTARVLMNRLWKQFFGVGLSKVLEDVGTQGETPPNQLLLDWLACEFMHCGWDFKHMVRSIVTSASYRQTSWAARRLQELDPDNRAVARQGRWRLEAELLRDNALWLAGLLDPTIGGPSAKPYQPVGYWENLNFPKRTYEPSPGAAQYRRGLYTWCQRTFPHPSLLALDAPSREECVAERARSNIPQQALVLLNDPTWVEAARAFAVRILRESQGDDTTRITWAWRQVLARRPDPDEIATLRGLLQKHRDQFRRDPASAQAYLQVGNSAVPGDLEAAEVAAWTNVARTMLNLHETITRS